MRQETSMYEPGLRKVPRQWVENYCREAKPELYSSDSCIFPETIFLTYSPYGKVAERMKERDIDLNGVAADLSSGFVLHKPNEDFFRFVGSAFQVDVVPDLNFGLPIAFVTNVNCTKLSLGPKPFTIEIRFSDISDKSKECNLKRIYFELQTYLGFKTYRKLHTPSKELHKLARKEYGSLRSLIKIMEHRANTESAASAKGVVRNRHKNDKANYKVKPFRETGKYTIVEILTQEGHFEDDSLVKITKNPDDIKGMESTRTQLIEIVDNHFYLLPKEKIALEPGDHIRIKFVPPFGMKRHSIALDKFLNQQVEGKCGKWEDLVHLMCEPQTLHLDPSPAPERFFHDEEMNSKPLNVEQRKAIAGALATPHAFFIQGPPGTGKTTVITEIISRLTSRGERILLLAPTHVAVDEVLRRIGDEEGIFPLRLSWDDSRVKDDLRRFTISVVEEELIKKIMNPQKTKRLEWQEEITILQSLNEALSCLYDIKKTGNRYKEIQNQISKNKNTIEIIEQIKELENELQDREEKGRFFLDRFLAIFGIGKIVDLRRRLNKKREKSKQLAENLKNLENEAPKLESELKSLREELLHKKNDFASVVSEASKTMKKALSRWKEAARVVDEEDRISLNEIFVQKEKLNKRIKSLKAYLKLEKRWAELTGMMGKSKINEEIGNELLSIINLVCSTSSGIGGAPIVRDIEFDALILDEASRVTDSEFLIGAVKARRWIMVGDEKQLPPYVDQNDEYHIHALSAIHMYKRDAADSLEKAVDILADLWREDEEIHVFRKKSVLETAKKILQNESWEKHYQKIFSETYEYFKGNKKDPDRAILETMQNYLVRSLFERLVEKCDSSLRQRLVIQRRMIKPIAAIVSDPVYEGNYKSPSDDDLAASGVTPLITSDFSCPVIFLDTSHYPREKAQEKLVGNSFVNLLEQDWIVSACSGYEHALRQRDENPITASIICFYRAQAQEIRRRLGFPGYSRFHKLKFQVIDAIDKIQGQESDLVFISFCRTCFNKSGPNKTFGQWLQDLRRLNVACTRARRALFFVGHKKTLSGLCTFDESRNFYNHLFSLFQQQTGSMLIIHDYK